MMKLKFFPLALASFTTIMICCATVFGQALAAQFEQQADRPRQSPLQRLLEYYDARYDSEQKMLKVEFRSPGYHSTITSGTQVHPTRESLYYAVALLKRGNAGDAERAQQIVGAVLPHQETRQSAPEYGVWPWVLEEPLDQMDSVDLNWADFCGSAIAQMLVEHSDQLDPVLQQKMAVSLYRASNAIKKRDVQPGYTNIAILGGGVCAIAGELLGDEQLLQYGRQRLESSVKHTATIDGFSEYNSPPYGKVVIGECERILQLAKDERVRVAAETLRNAAWKMIGQSFHPATQQWAGPHSRTSSLRLSQTMVEFLNARIGTDSKPAIKLHPQAYLERPRGYAVVTPIPCPAQWQPRFKSLGRTSQLRRTFIPQKGSSPATIGTTWFSGDACLGSVSRSSFWTQRKPVVAYWKTDDDPAVAFRVRFLHDGKDFSSMGLRSTQDHHRVLCAVHSMQRRGAWHRTLDRPADGIFHAQDLRVRLELTGKKVSARANADGSFSLRAGEHEIAVCPADSEFAGQALVWKIDNGQDVAAVEGICYSGESRKIDFSQPIEMKLGFGFELRRSGGETKLALPTLQSKPGKTIARWDVAPAGEAKTEELTIAVPNG